MPRSWRNPQSTMVAYDALCDREVSEVLKISNCSLPELQRMAALGLVRFPNFARGGKRVCITPRGLKYIGKGGDEPIKGWADGVRPGPNPRTTR
jgi:hypothetical protein